MTRREEAEAKRQEKLGRERERVANMRRFEQEAAQEILGQSRESACSGESAFAKVLICGIDEAGRGPLAGPVAAGACILPADQEILWINDSKKLSEKRRSELYDVITDKALAWEVALVSPERIDEINILQATYEAMQKAVRALSVQPDVLVVDAVRIPDLDIPQVSMIRADAQCLSVAAASILAKVTRDRLMQEADRLYPEYGFAQHKGYGTSAHIEAIRKYGPCPIHRRTFLTHFLTE